MLKNTSIKFHTPAKKYSEDEDIKIHTYNTLINFYIQNGYQAETLSTLEELAKYYGTIGRDDEVKKVFQLITKIKLTYDVGNKNYLDGQKQSLPYNEELADNNIPGLRQTDVKQAAVKQSFSDFFDLENALNNNHSDDLNNRKSVYKTSVFSSEEKMLQLPHEEIFKEMKNNTENNPDKNSPDFHYNLGIAHQQLCQFEEAIEEFLTTLSYLKKYQERNIASIINSSDCYVNLAKCYIAINKPSKADEYVRKGNVIDSLTKEEQIILKKFTSVSSNTDKNKNRFYSIPGYMSPIKNLLFGLRKLKTTRKF